MKAEDVIELYETLEKNEISIWLDGGWGVAALLGEQIRPHEDVDIIVQEKDLPKIRELLTARGYKDIERDDTRPWNFVLGDEKGHLVDIHAFRYDNAGNGLYGNKGLTFPAPSFKGVGKINGHTVRCISAEQIIIFHTDYEPDENDYKDVSALCKKFGIEFPKEYARFKQS